MVSGRGGAGRRHGKHVLCVCSLCARARAWACLCVESVAGALPLPCACTAGGRPLGRMPGLGCHQTGHRPTALPAAPACHLLHTAIPPRPAPPPPFRLRGPHPGDLRPAEQPSVLPPGALHVQPLHIPLLPDRGIPCGVLCKRWARAWAGGGRGGGAGGAGGRRSRGQAGRVAGRVAGPRPGRAGAGPASTAPLPLPPHTTTPRTHSRPHYSCPHHSRRHLLPAAPPACLPCAPQ